MASRDESGRLKAARSANGGALRGRHVGAALAIGAGLGLVVYTMRNFDSNYQGKGGLPMVPEKGDGSIQPHPPGDTDSVKPAPSKKSDTVQKLNDATQPMTGGSGGGAPSRSS